MRKRSAKSEIRSPRSDVAAVASDLGLRICVYGLFLAPKIHPDTATDFFVALKFRVIERQQIVAVPLTLRQFVAAMQPFAGHTTFSPARLRQLLDACVEAAFAAETGEEWLAGLDAALRRWLTALGAPPALLHRPPQAIPLPLFT
jgi:hypothetical protein